MSSSSQTPPSLRSALPRALILSGLFLLAVGGAWAWYNVNPKRFDTAYQFSVRTRIPGMAYRTNAVDATVVETLATTNLVDGVFEVNGVPKYAVFMGTWDTANSKQMGVVAHTPDICWVGVGWVPVALGQPNSTELEINGVKLPFELRVFQAGESTHREMAMWCTLISGQVFEESTRFAASRPLSTEAPAEGYDPGKNQGAASRAHSAGQFVRILQNRIAGDGSKQFVRFSTAVDRDWKRSLEDLRGFAAQWLELQVSHPASSGVASSR